MKKPVTVSNLTLSLWLDFVRPVLRSLNMLEEVPAKDDTHEYTAEVIEEATAEEITHCMTVSCFNAHGNGKYATLEEAAQMVYQMEVSIEYRPAIAETLATIRNALAIKVAEIVADTEPATETAKNEKEEKTMFPNLTAAVNAHFDEAAAKFAAALDTMTTGEALNGWYYRDNMTAAALRIAQETNPAEPLPVKVREKMLSRFNRENERDRQKYLQRLEIAANAPELEDLTVCVEWAKNRTWGANPTATVTVNHDHRTETTGHASGCGYDKESAAIANAMNANAAVLRILYTHAEKGGKFAYSVYTFAGLPYFDGGCGVSCFRNVFDGCGYRWENATHRKHFDMYTLTPAA